MFVSPYRRGNPHMTSRLRATMMRIVCATLASFPLLTTTMPAQAAKWTDIFPSGVSPGDCVRIPAGVHVDYDAATLEQMDVLWVQGSFAFDDSGPRSINAHMIVVDGTFEVGQDSVPFTNEARQTRKRQTY